MARDGVVDFGQNPWGQQDKRMTVIAFQTPDGAPIANVVHYGAHCTAAGTNTEITRDWAGVMIDRLEAESGAPTLFLNGAAGDVGPRLTNGKTKATSNYVMELGSVAAPGCGSGLPGNPQLSHGTLSSCQRGAGASL